MKLIILDRDGVINVDSDDYIKSPDEWLPIEGSLEAIGRLNAAGYKVAIATNQSGIARGYYDIETLNAMHIKMQQLLEPFNAHIDYITYCPHGPDDHCHCRKPLPGMLQQIAGHYQADLSDVYFIGDNFSDITAAQNAGCLFALVRTGKGAKVEEELIRRGQPYPVFDDLFAFTDWYVS